MKVLISNTYVYVFYSVGRWGAFWCGFSLLGTDVGWCELIIEPLASLVSNSIFDNEGNFCFTLWMVFFPRKAR